MSRRTPDVNVVRADERAQVYTSKQGLDLRNLSGRYGPFEIAGADGRGRAAGRQRADADEPSRRGARDRHRGRARVHDRRRDARARARATRSTSGHGLPHSWANPTDDAGARDLARGAVFVATMRIVVAIGGNALIRAGQAGTWERAARQRARDRRGGASRCARPATRSCSRTATARRSARCCCSSKLGEAETPPLPLDALTAMTQGWIGYLLESSFAELDPNVADRGAAHARDGRPRGRRRSRRRPSRSARSTTSARRAGSPPSCGWDVAPDAGRGWRRVVPRPRPLRGARRATTCARCSPAARW